MRDKMPDATAQIISKGELEMRVCVPADWTDADIERYANYEDGRVWEWKVSERTSCTRRGQVHAKLAPLAS